MAAAWKKIATEATLAAVTCVAKHKFCEKCNLVTAGCVVCTPWFEEYGEKSMKKTALTVNHGVVCK